ncbi:hypothetical protein GCM10020367_39020 [Streptomyces sannanensis]|uniref:Integral membrane protein n=1 Tax=Streptomyces sannanensis TaxID=285536 RepID=A0ABP6SFG7_9ACTN
MPDRRRRAALRPLPFARPAGAPVLRERSSSSTGASGSDGWGSDNPFAPPPEGRPDQPWQPRRPANGGSGDGEGSPDSAGSPGDGGNTPEDRPVWGSQWSSRQPGRAPGGFGGRPGGQGGPEGPGGPGSGLRWDPTDPVQRRARYALLSGMWAFFFALFGQIAIALLLGSLALYWGISSLRATPKPRPDGNPQAGKPQRTAAVSGLVTASLALMMVATAYTTQIVYRDFYTCVDDSLTKTAQVSCNQMLPEWLRPAIGVRQ